MKAVVLLRNLVLLCGAVSILHVHCWDCVKAYSGEWLPLRHSEESFSKIYYDVYNDLMKPCKLAEVGLPAGRSSSLTTHNARTTLTTHNAGTPLGKSIFLGRRGGSELQSACCTLQIMLEFHPEANPKAKSSNIYRAIDRERQVAGRAALPSPIMAFNTVKSANRGSKVRSANHEVEPAMGMSSSVWMSITDGSERFINIIPYLVTHPLRGDTSNAADKALKYYNNKLKSLDCVAAYAPDFPGRHSAQSYSSQEPELYSKVMTPCMLGSKARSEAKPTELTYLESYCCTMQVLLEFDPKGTSLRVYNFVRDRKTRVDSSMFDPFFTFNKLMDMTLPKPPKQRKRPTQPMLPTQPTQPEESPSDTLPPNAWFETRSIIERYPSFITIIPSLAQPTHPNLPDVKVDQLLALEYFESYRNPKATTLKYEDA